jgi:hypothetical protein
MLRWGFVESPACDCGAEEQTMRHIVEDCPLRLFDDGLTGLCAVRVPIWFGLESLMNVFNFKIMVIRINK